MNPSDVLKYGHRTLMKTLEAFPKEEVYTQGACGFWSVKDIVAHYGSFELVLVEVLNLFLDGGPTPYLDEFASSRRDDFNDVQVSKRAEMSMEQVLEEYLNAHDEAMAAAARIPDEIWNKQGALPGYGEQYDLGDFIVYTFYGHKREHSGQIAVFRDQFVSE
ncbi:MAG: DinB family protein [Anaerolineales bacterium]|jgi:hypothetical protein